MSDAESGADGAWAVAFEQLHQASLVLVERASAISWRDLGCWSVTMPGTFVP